jgi:hypothetical protein
MAAAHQDLAHLCARHHSNSLRYQIFKERVRRSSERADLMGAKSFAGASVSVLDE